MTQKTARVVATTIVPAAVKIRATPEAVRQHLAVVREVVPQLVIKTDLEGVAAQVLPRQAAAVTPALEPQLVTEADLEKVAAQVVPRQRAEATQAVVP